MVERIRGMVLLIKVALQRRIRELSLRSSFQNFQVFKAKAA
jgi:hypothetical protein